MLCHPLCCCLKLASALQDMERALTRVGWSIQSLHERETKDDAYAAWAMTVSEAKIEVDPMPPAVCTWPL